MPFEKFSKQSSKFIRNEGKFLNKIIQMSIDLKYYVCAIKGFLLRGGAKPFS